MEFSKTSIILSKRALSIFAVIVIVVFVIGVFSFNFLNRHFDQLKFQTVREHVMELQESLQTELPLAKWELTSACSRANEKLREGEARCGTSVSTIYEADSLNEMRIFEKKIHDAILNKQGIFSHGSGPQNPLLNLREDDQKLTDGLLYGYDHSDLKTEVRCYSNFDLRRTEKIILGYNFSCSDQALDTWFPRNDLSSY